MANPQTRALKPQVPKKITKLLGNVKDDKTSRMNDAPLHNVKNTGISNTFPYLHRPK